MVLVNCRYPGYAPKHVCVGWDYSRIIRYLEFITTPEYSVQKYYYSLTVRGGIIDRKQMLVQLQTR